MQFMENRAPFPMNDVHYSYMKKLLPTLFIAFLLYSLVIYLSAPFKNYDTQSYNVIGVLTLNGISVYPDPAISRHPYLPFFLFLETGALLLARLIHIPQIIILKFIFTLFHLFSVYAIYRLTKKNIKTTFLYAINPISLLIIAFHGQFDIIPLTLLLYSIVLLGEKRYSHVTFLLGLAFTAKTWPILFIVPFLKRIPKKFWLVFCIPPLFFLLTYTALFFSTSFVSIVRVIAVYQGVGGIWGFGKFLSLLEADKLTLLIYKMLFVSGLLLYSVLQKKEQIIEELMTLLFTFFIFTPGFGIQWLIWPLPFFFLSKKPMVSSFLIPFFIALTVAYVSWIYPHIVSEAAVSSILFLTSVLFPLYIISLPQLMRFKKWIP